MSDMTDCLKELINSLTPGTIAIVKLSNGLKKTPPRDLSQEMEDAEMTTPPSGGGYQGGDGV